jgi:hypothetical protein
LPSSWTAADVQAAFGQPRFVRRHTSPKEDSLIQDLLALYSGRTRQQMYRALYDQRA